MKAQLLRLNKKLFSLLLLWFVGIILFVLLVPTRLFAAAQTSLTMSPATYTLIVNQTASENISIATGNNRIVSADIIFTYNPSLIAVSDITLGTFLPNANVIQKTIDNTNGKVIFSIYTTLENAKSGTGTLATYTYTTKAAGSTSIAFDEASTIVYGVGEGNVLTGTSPLQVTITQTGVTVTDTPAPTSPPSSDGGGGSGGGSGGGGGGGSNGGSGGGGISSPSGGGKTGDINKDGKVNIFDLSILLRNWNKASADADLNHDGRVNIFDLSILLRNWGK